MIFNFSANDVDFGNYESDNEFDAKEMFAKDAGYESWNDMIERAGDGVIVEEVIVD